MSSGILRPLCLGLNVLVYEDAIKGHRSVLPGIYCIRCQLVSAAGQGMIQAQLISVHYSDEWGLVHVANGYIALFV